MNKNGESGQRVKALREQLGLNQAEFAERLAFGRTVISQIENGKREGKAAFWRAIDRLEVELGHGPAKSGQPAGSEQRGQSRSEHVREDGHEFSPRTELRRARERAGLSPEQLAKLIRYPANLIRNVESGAAHASEGFIDAVCRQLPVLEKEQLMGGSDVPHIIDQSGVTGTMGSKSEVSYPREVHKRRVPLLSRAQAGMLNAWSDEEYGYESVDAPDLKGKRIFALRIEGDSMYPRLSPGDLVYLDADKTPREGDIVVARKIDGDVMCKSYSTREAGKLVVLTSYNSALYPEYVLPRQEFSWIYPVMSVFIKIRDD